MAEMTTRTIEGVCAFMATPTTPAGDVDLAATCRHALDLVARGVHGLTLFGSTGSNGSFTEQEKRDVLSATLEAVGGRVPVMFGIGSITTAETLRLARFAEEAGADAVLAVPINYWTPTPRELVRHYRTVADATALPFWIYNNPGLAGVDITPDLVAEIARSSSVVGIKESSGDYNRVLTIPHRTQGQVRVGAGYETFVVEALALGAAAWFCGAGNMIPEACVEVWDAVRRNDHAAAFAVQRRIFPLCELFGRYGHVRVVADGLARMHRGVGAARPPLLPLEPDAIAELEAAIEIALGHAPVRPGA